MKTKLVCSLGLVVILVFSSSVAIAGKIPESTAQASGEVSSSTRYIMNPFWSPDWIGESDIDGAEYATSVASAGDVNGDGYDDVIVGAHFYSHGENMEGRAYVYHGSSSGLKPLPAWTFESNTIECELGWSVASAGDVNGDGFDDVLVGSEYCSPNPATVNREGRVYLFHGSASGLPTTPSWTLNGTDPQESLGAAIASAGDVNKDGYSDVIIGAPWWTKDDHLGKVYLFYGSGSGLPTTASLTIEGSQNWSGLGSSVASAGDVNGDGYDDIIVGQDHMDNPEADEGRAYVFPGSSTGIQTLPMWQFENNVIDSVVGESVASAGDVNNDGFDDVIVGGFRYSNPDTREGVAYLFLGSASGPSTTPAWKSESNQAYAEFGQSVSSAGDVNQDGYDDILVGAPWFSNGQAFEGAAFLYFGSPIGLLASTVFMAESNQVEANLGYYARTAGDVNGDGLADIIVGAQRYDGGQGNEGRAIVYQGVVDATSQLFLPLTMR